ncbi:MAG: UDP-N-acetylmuramoyl-tripeptide--D-alanyl-D-alanine ligase, partial [Alphaproteobacteria bacterium]|nr:UDP-N-acetylmuramoyl-tripeptide--D-alanyl-D-alanine ligase [Alphaproteobacteria bacterium]
MIPLWTSHEIAAATGGRTETAFAATGVSIDSRTLAPGDLFVAIKGASLDGHNFVAKALAAGAAAALVSRRPADIAADAPLVVVPDVE